MTRRNTFPFPPKTIFGARSSAALVAASVLSGVVSLACGISKPPAPSAGAGGAAGASQLGDSGGQGGATAAGGGDAGGAGGGDAAGAGGGGAGGAGGGDAGGAGGGLSATYLPGTLELVAGAMPGQGEPAVPYLGSEPPLGFGPGIYVPVPGHMVVANDTVYAAPSPAFLGSGSWDLVRQPYMVDLSTQKVSGIPRFEGTEVLARAFAMDGLGTMYVAAPGCAVYRLGPDEKSPTLIWPARSTCVEVFIDTPVLVTAVGLAVSSGHVYLTGSDVPGVLDIDPLTQVGTVIPGTDGLADIAALAAGSDGMLYVSSQGMVFRVDPVLGGAVPFVAGGSLLVADGAGHLFDWTGSTVDRIDLATGTRVVAAGVSSLVQSGTSSPITLGPLPGSVGMVTGLATTPAGDLIIASDDQYRGIILRAHFSSTP